VVKAIQQHIGYILAEIVRVALHVREERVEVHQGVRVHVFENVHVVAFERVNEEESVRVHVTVWLGPFFFTALGGALDIEQLARGRAVRLDDHTSILVNLEPRMDAQHRRIWSGVGWQSVEVETVLRIGDPAIQRLELVTLERPCLVDTAVEKLDDDPLLLYVTDPESVVRQWRDERRFVGKAIEFV
jgi:hypothetical protein